MENSSNRLVSEIVINDAFFQLIKFGLRIGKVDNAKLSHLDDNDWDCLFRLSCNHDVAALVSDALSFSNDIPISIEERLKFIGMQEIYEKAYDNQIKIIAELLDFYNTYGIPTMIIKGISLSQYYPAPSHRKYGDVDIFQFGFQPKSDCLISNLLGIEVRQYKVSPHTNYKYKELSVENHFSFLMTYYGGNSSAIESLLEEELHQVMKSEINGRPVLFPTPNFNALYLICHSASHFRGYGLTIRQLIDWMMFLRNEYDNVDWAKVYGVYESFNLSVFVNAINGILIHVFDMPSSFAYNYESNECLEKKILNDTLLAPSHSLTSCDWFGKIKQEWNQYITAGWKYKIFSQNGPSLLLKKLCAFMKHPGDFQEQIIFPLKTEA